MGAIIRGEQQPARGFVVESPDVKAIRAGYRLSQVEIRYLAGDKREDLTELGTGPRGLPEGPARVLLQVAAKRPEAVWDAVRPG